MEKQGSALRADEQTTELQHSTYVTEGNWNWLVKECGTGELFATCATQQEAWAKSRELDAEYRGRA